MLMSDFKEVNATSNAFKAGHEYEIKFWGKQVTAVKTVNTATFNDVHAIARAVTGI